MGMYVCVHAPAKIPELKFKRKDTLKKRDKILNDLKLNIFSYFKNAINTYAIGLVNI